MAVSVFATLRLLLPIALAVAVVNSMRITNMMVNQCDSNEDYPVRVHDIIVSLERGRLILGGSVSVSYDLEAPVTVSLLMPIHPQLLGRTMMVPCTNGLGSCTYNDVCTFADVLNSTNSDEVCGLLEGLGFPCSCPIPKGEYALQRTEIPVGDGIISSMAGSYGLQVNATHNGQPLSCYQISFSLTS